ncbi:hypothetical protein V565_094180 [Rhizoctonia solani 123E]|uniref:Uncharacterized protein n=1 Tax=Rhizoctonia solani 123E TaxID=1423351 RepID=A0A074RRS9_9AGAM|nr:hypothetical protein V565_094180 [Rhizoctonia solani 123E]
MSRSDRPTIPVTSQVSSSSPARSTRSQEPKGVLQEKRNNRRTTVCGDSDTLGLSSPTYMKIVPVKQKSLPTPKCSPSPAMSSASGSSSSSDSSFSDSEVHTSSGQYTPDSSPEPESKQQLGTPSPPSLFDDSTRTTAANAAITDIIHRLVVCVKGFKPTSELDFSATTEEQPLALVDNEKNRPFINQLRKLAGLRNELAAILTHGDKTLEDKVRNVEMSIRRALERMKEHQLKLYEQFTSQFDHVHSTLNEYVASFEYPSELYFVSDPEKYGMVLLNNDKNKPFIDQLRKLDALRTWLAEIPTHDQPERKAKCQAVGAAVDQAIKDMRKHQYKLWKNNSKAHRSPPMNSASRKSSARL